jgi:hypothetical protein
MSNILHSNQAVDLFNAKSDKFGYYSVGSNKFYSKLLAIKAQTISQNKEFVHWHFHDDAFASKNWAVEPDISLTTLYKWRAEQLRQKYDYIVLFYSGGADSTNILDTFINNNIPIDEIACYHNLAGSQSTTFGPNAEVFGVALPKIKSLSGVKITVIDHSQGQYDYFDTIEKYQKAIHEMAFSINPSSVYLSRKWLLNQSWLDMITAGKKIAFVVGIDKPRLYLENQKYCVRFLDIFDSTAVTGIDAPIEFFYWTPDLPELVIKQAHVIKNYLLSQNHHPRFFNKTPTGLAWKETPEGRLWLNSDGVHSLLYPSWDINTFSIGKTPSSVFCRRDQWWFSKIHQDSKCNMFYSSTQDWWNQVPIEWRNHPNDIAQGIKLNLSQPYWLQ